MSLFWNLRRRVLDQPQVRAMVDAARFWRRYGTPRPTSLRLANSGNTLYVDRHERRGRNVLMCGADGQPCVKQAWQNAIARFHPTLVVDIGLNYGEFLFDATYPQDTVLLGIEANDSLRRWIERSAKQHPNARQIRLAFAFASDVAAATQTFYIDPASSGQSSGIQRADSVDLVSVAVPTVTIDSFFAEQSESQLAGQRLLFKMDVEGYEPYVLRGMPRLLRHCTQRVGIMEFNSQLVTAGGVDPRQFLTDVAAAFPIVFVRKRETFVRTNWETLLTGLAAGEKFKTDLLLVSGQAVVQSLGLNGS